MLLSILIILFIGIVAFFHYVQGFFSATISAMITILAAVLAVSYHETVVNMLLKGKMADMAYSMVLCMIFAVVYIVLRVIFDAAIPGNVRTPSTVDKVGAGLMGIVSGIFVTGIFAIAVQMLPFDPTISFMGAARYHVEDKKDIVVPVANSNSKDSFLYEELTDSKLSPEQFKGLLIPVDDWVLDAVYHLSDGGSLAGDKSLASVHPDYLQELFGERLGIQTGARRVTLNINGTQNIDVPAVFTVGTLPCFDGQLSEMRSATYKPLFKLEKNDKNGKDSVAKGVVAPTPDQRIVIVRVKVKSAATDYSDQMFRFSAGSVHLVGKGHDNVYKDFYPIGMLENGSAVLLNKPDDFLFCKGDGGFDAVFVVDDTLLTGGKSAVKLAAGVSITVKRMASLDLSGMDISESLTSDASIEVVRPGFLKDRLKDKLPPAAPTVAAGPAPTPTAPVSNGNSGSSSSSAAPVNPSTPTVAQGPEPTALAPIAASLTASMRDSFSLPGTQGISTTAADAEAQDAPVAGGKISLKAGKITIAQIDPTAPLAQLNSGGTPYSQLDCPSNRSMMMVTVRPYQDSWDWLRNIGDTKVVDSNGNTFAPNGYYQLVKSNSSDVVGLFFRYDSSRQNIGVSQPAGTPSMEVVYIFLIPHDTDIKSFTMAGKVQDFSAAVHVQ